MTRDFPFKFSGYHERVTTDMLNMAYGDKGRSFKTEVEAREYMNGRHNVYLSRLINYNDRDIVRSDSLTGRFWKVFPLEGAVPFTVGWLVSHGPEELNAIKKKKPYGRRFN